MDTLENIVMRTETNIKCCLIRIASTLEHWYVKVPDYVKEYSNPFPTSFMPATDISR